MIGYIGYGAAREKVALAADRLIAIPDGLDFDRAAGLIVTYGTTLHALKDRAKLKPGETLAVLGAAGGTGLAAVELGKLMGARVIACASSDDKLAFARQHGADDGIELRQRRSQGRAAPLDRRQGRRCHLRSGRRAPRREAALRSIAWEGRFLVIGFAAGDIPKLPLNLVLLKELRRARRLLGRLDRARSAPAIAPT